MKLFAQIENNRAYWIFESEERPNFAKNIVLVDITDIYPVPKKGDVYDMETGTFTEPIVEEPVIVETVEERLVRIEERQEQSALTQVDILMTIFEQVMMKEGV